MPSRGPYCQIHSVPANTRQIKTWCTLHSISQVCCNLIPENPAPPPPPSLSWNSRCDVGAQSLEAHGGRPLAPMGYPECHGSREKTDTTSCASNRWLEWSRVRRLSCSWHKLPIKRSRKYPASWGFFLAWPFVFRKLFAWFVSRVVEKPCQRETQKEENNDNNDDSKNRSKLNKLLT